MTGPERQPEERRDERVTGEATLVQAAVERFIAARGAAVPPNLDEFGRELPDTIRDRVLAQCREFLAFDGLLGPVEWDPAEEPGTTGRAFGEFDIEEELGRGGMGIVYLARERSLDRRVALKVMASGLTLSKLHVERFRREAASAAQLAHRAIVPVHRLVEVDSTFAIAMEYIAGRNLGDILDDLRLANGPEPSAVEGTLGLAPEKGYVAECAIFCAEVASALEAAHAKGVIHRDIKPRNLMLDDRRQPRLLDFGLSKSLDDGSISMSGEITGTVYYMSPEQTLAKRVEIDHRADVFALGVILYEMLTLRRPFEGRNMQQVVSEICFREPVSPHRLNPKVPRDLVTICLKALEKDPNNRYRSAGEFEADLLRFLRWEPIQARPTGALVRLSKWLHRRRTEAIAGAVVLAFAASWLGYSWYSSALDNREADRHLQDAERFDAAGDFRAAADSATRALARRDDSEIQMRIQLYREKIERAAKELEWSIAESRRLSLESTQEIPRDRELAILLALEAVGRHAAPDSTNAVLRALGGGFRRLTLEAHTGNVLCARWSPDGTKVVTTGTAKEGNSTAELWSANGERLHTLGGHGGWIVNCAFHPAGELVATASADRTVKLWSVEDGQLKGIWQHDAPVDFVRFDEDGRRALTLSNASPRGPFHAKVWDVETGRCAVDYSEHSQFPTAAALSPRGRFVASAGDNEFVLLWSADTGKSLARLDGHRGLVQAVEFLPDGTQVATACLDGRIRIYSVPDGELLAEFGHSRAVHAIAFDRAGDRLLSGSADRTARLWRLARTESGLDVREEHQFVGHTAGLTSVGFDRDGKHVVTADKDGVLRVFDAGRSSWSAGVELVRFETGTSLVRGATFDHEGQRILAWGHRRALIWDFTDTRGVVTLRQRGKVPAACFDRTGQHVLSAGDDEYLRLWDAHTGRQRWQRHLGNPLDAIAIDAAGERVVASTDGGKVHVHRIKDGEPLFTLDGHRDDVPVVRFAARAPRILTAGDDGLAIVWNANDRSAVMRLERERPIVSADLSADGSLLATVEGESFVRLWSVPDGTPRGELGGKGGTIGHVAFRPDGQAVATAFREGDVQVWLLDGSPAQRIRTETRVVHFAWSPDGKHLLTSASGDDSSRLWDVARPTEPLLRFEGHGNTVESNSFSPDGSWAVTASRDGTVCVWPVDPVGTARRLPLRSMTEAERREHRLVRDASPR